MPDLRILKKVCKNCSKPKKTTDFSPRKRSWLGVRSVCRKCENERKRLWRNNDADKQRKRQKDWHEDNREKGMHASLKAKSKKRNITFDIQVADIFVPKRCPILGIKLRYNKGHAEPNSPSVDRINPSKGYVKGNIQVISHKANAMKQNANISELLKFSEWIIAYAKTLPNRTTQSHR